MPEGLSPRRGHAAWDRSERADRCRRKTDRSVKRMIAQAKPGLPKPAPLAARSLPPMMQIVEKLLTILCGNRLLDLPCDRTDPQQLGHF